MGQVNFDWSEYRQRRKTFLFALGSFVPVVFVFELVRANAGFFVATLLYFAWGVLLLIPLGIRFVKTPCPRCSQPFNLNGFGYPFGPACLHCGLKTGQTEESADSVSK